MIKNLLFALKALGITVILVLVLQVKVGETSLEDLFHTWIKKSVFVEPIQEAIDGGVVLTKAGYKKANSGIGKMLAKITRHHKEKDRGQSLLNIKRYNDDEEDDGDDDSSLPASKTQVKPARTY